MDPAPKLDDTDCETTTIWTFDFQIKECKELTGCFPAGNQESNMFPSEIGCILWCSMTYE